MDTQRMWDCPSNVQNRVVTWLNRKKFNPERLRGVLLGIILTATLGEVSAYKLIWQDIRAGELPSYFADLMIVLFAIFEAMVAPFISWWGYRWRRSLLIGYASAVTLISVSWFFMPGTKEKEESELCNAANANNKISYEGISGRAIGRLVIIMFTCMAFIISRVGCWCHGVAYSDEYAPERTSVHYGVILISRVLPLILGHSMLTGAVEKNLTLQTVALVVGFLFNLLQLFFVVPKTVPEVDGIQKESLPYDERSLLMSVGRVLYNSVAMTQIFSMGLLAAALWGYGYHELEILKVKFNLTSETSGSSNASQIVMYHFLIVIVAYAGVKFSAPILMEFCNLKAIKYTIVMSVLVFIVYIVLTTVPRCDRGVVAGLGRSYYGHPECSLACNCKPKWDEFQPVCMVDTMVTYVSPCQAGCSNTEFVNGIEMFSNCTCAGTGPGMRRALSGACGAECASAYQLHAAFFFTLVTFTLLAFQAQGVLLLRAVDPRDKSVVMGIAWSMVALITFVCGHLVFLGIRVATCGWYEAEQCHLQSQVFPYLIGSTSAFLTLTSMMTSITTFICMKMANKAQIQTNFQTHL